MDERLQVYFCEVSPCAHCGRQIARGSRVFTDRAGNEFCSLDCGISDAILRRMARVGVLKSRYANWKGTHKLAALLLKALPPHVGINLDYLEDAGQGTAYFKDDTMPVLIDGGDRKAVIMPMDIRKNYNY